MRTLGQLRADTLTRLGDTGNQIWSNDEVDGQLRTAYQTLATTCGVFWDMVYLENLPASFSYTAAWEQPFLGFDAGLANFTMEDERRLLGDARLRTGPANHTSVFEATDGALARAGASVDIPATAELPKTLTALDRVTWDARGLDALEARRLQALDARYELTKGEVYGYVWQKDGIRTLRKVRVPSAQADTVTVDGAWGALRDPADLSTDAVTGSWGVPRQIPGHHPIGPDLFGAPRRPYLDGKNVRVEQFRQGRALTAASDVCELSDRYALYLRDYAQGKCLERPGPGQDVTLAQHFAQRWARGLARVVRRLQVVDAQRVVVLGGDGRPTVRRPPRPSLPWPYGAQVR